MSHEPLDTTARPAGNDRVGRHQDLFCIHSYAGEQGPPCGWRGSTREASRDATDGTRRCPRCGRTTLIELSDTDTHSL